MGLELNFIDPRAKVFHHPHRLAMIKAGGVPPPVNVEIDLTNRCSLGCEWCHFGYTHTRGLLAGKREKPDGAIAGGDVMETRLARKILTDLSLAGVNSVTWTGGGEPTLHPEFDMITSANPLEQGIYTHGGHISPERAAMMKERFMWVYVSLDCPDRTSYRQSKGVDYFDRATAGIRNLVEAKGTATIGVGFLISSENWRTIDAMVALGHELGADYIQFRPAVQYEQTAPGCPAEDTAWMTDCIKALEWVSTSKVIVDIDRFRMYRDWNGHGYNTCYYSGLSTVITPNGNVWTCVNKREHAGEMMGNLNDESFSDIWARRTLAHVNGDCRVMCRGHIANLTLNEVMKDTAHVNFI